MHLVKDTLNAVRYLEQVSLRFALDPARATRAGFRIASELAMERRIGVRTAYRGFQRPESRLADAMPSQPLSYDALQQIERDVIRRETPLRAFVDVGCGRGRALAYLSKLPFQVMIGVEVDSEVARLAEANVLRIRDDWRRAGPITVVIGDALDFDVPREGAVLLLCNPFGTTTLRAVLTKMKASLDAHPEAAVDAYYAFPVHHRVFREVFPRAAASTLPCDGAPVFHYRLAGSKSERARSP